MASNHHSFEDFATAVAWEAGKLLVTERVKVAPPKAMEMRIKATEGGKIPEALEYWGGVGGLEAQELRKRPRHQPVQKLLIGLIADSTTNEHYNFKLDVGM
ncbi:hypothetical protein ACFX1S_005273 [Malus domestica]